MTRTRSTPATATAALFWLALAAVPASGEIDYTEFDLAELMGMDLVYGASTYEQNIMQAPSAVTVITADEIAAYGFQTLDEVLDSVAGYYVTSDRNYGYVGIRGFNRPGDYGTRQLVLVDGHRMNDNVYLQAASEQCFAIPLESIKRIEIVRGPSASLYGAGAFFGIVNIVTRSGADYAGAEISAGAGSQKSYEGSAAWGGRLAGGPMVSATANWRQSGGRDLYFPEFDHPETNHGVYQDNDRERVGRVHFHLDHGQVALRAAHSRRQKHVPTAPWETVFNDPRTKTLDERSFLSASWLRPTGTTGELLLTASYDHAVYEGSYPYELDEDDVVVNRDSSLGRWVSVGARWSGRLGARHRLVAAADFRGHVRREQESIYDGDEEPVLWSDEPSEEYGLSLQDEIRLAETLTANLGVRYDRFASFEATSPRVGLIWQVHPRTTVKALYGESFRAPNAYELHYHDGLETMKDNPELDPETIRSWEVILHQDLTPRLKAMVSAFSYRIDALISQVSDPDDDLLVFRNVDQVAAQGVEVAIDGRLLRGVRGRGSYSYQTSEDRSTGEALVNSPRHLAKLNILVPLFGPRATAGIQARYTSERLTLQENVATDFFWLGLTLQTRTRCQRLSLRFMVDNLLDTAYGDPGSGEHLQAIIPKDGRTYRAIATVAW